MGLGPPQLQVLVQAAKMRVLERPNTRVENARVVVNLGACDVPNALRGSTRIVQVFQMQFWAIWKRSLDSHGGAINVYNPPVRPFLVTMKVLNIKLKKI